MKKKKVAIVGTGNFAHTHMKALVSQRAEVIAVLSRSSQRAHKFADRYGLKAYTDLEAMIQQNKPDLLDIVTVHSLHAELAQQAAELGVHVIVEKPVATNSEVARKLYDLCSSRKIALSVISQSLFDPCFQKLKKLVDNKYLGSPVQVNIQASFKRSQDYYDKSQWRQSKLKAGGGVLINQGIHLIDVMTWLFGKPLSVKAHIATLGHEIEVEDTALCRFSFADGNTVLLHVDTNCQYHKPVTIDIRGPEGFCLLRGNHIYSMKTKNGVVHPRVIALVNIYLLFRGIFSKSRAQINLENQFSHIFQYIGSPSSLLSDTKRAIESLEVVEACYKSGEMLQELELKE